LTFNGTSGILLEKGREKEGEKRREEIRE